KRIISYQTFFDSQFCQSNNRHCVNPNRIVGTFLMNTKKKIKLPDKIRSELTESHIIPVVTLPYKFAKVVVNCAILTISALGAFSLINQFFKFIVLVVENL